MLNDIYSLPYADRFSGDAYTSKPFDVAMYALQDPAASEAEYSFPRSNDQDYMSLGIVALEDAPPMEGLVLKSTLGSRSWIDRFLTTNHQKRAGIEMALQNFTPYMFDVEQEPLGMQLESRVAMREDQLVLAGESLEDAGVELPAELLKVQFIFMDAKGNLLNEEGSLMINPADRDFMSHSWNDIVCKYSSVLAQSDPSNAQAVETAKVIAEHGAKDEVCLHFRVRCSGDNEARPGRFVNGQYSSDSDLFIVGTPTTNPMKNGTTVLTIVPTAMEEAVADASVTADAAPAPKAQNADDRSSGGYSAYDAYDCEGNVHATGGDLKARGGFLPIVATVMGAGFAGMGTHMAIFWSVMIMGALLFLVASCIGFFSAESENVSSGTASHFGMSDGQQKNVAKYGGMGICVTLGLLPFFWTGSAGLAGALAFGGLSGIMMVHQTKMSERGSGGRGQGGAPPDDEDPDVALVRANQKMVHDSMRKSKSPSNPTAFWVRMNHHDELPMGDAHDMHSHLAYYAFVVICKSSGRRRVPWILTVDTHAVTDRTHFLQNQIFSQTWTSMYNVWNNQEKIEDDILRVNVRLRNRVENATKAGQDVEDVQRKNKKQVRDGLMQVRKQYKQLHDMFSKIVDWNKGEFHTMNLFKLVELSCCNGNVKAPEMCKHSIQLLKDKFATSDKVVVSDMLRSFDPSCALIADYVKDNGSSTDRRTLLQVARDSAIAMTYPKYIYTLKNGVPDKSSPYMLMRSMRKSCREQYSKTRSDLPRSCSLQRSLSQDMALSKHLRVGFWYDVADWGEFMNTVVFPYSRRAAYVVATETNGGQWVNMSRADAGALLGNGCRVRITESKKEAIVVGTSIDDDGNDMWTVRYEDGTTSQPLPLKQLQRFSNTCHWLVYGANGLKQPLRTTTPVQTKVLLRFAKRNERLPYDEQDLTIANLTWSDAGNRKKQADIIAIGAAMRAHVKSALALRDGGARTTSSSPAAAAPSTDERTSGGQKAMTTRMATRHQRHAKVLHGGKRRSRAQRRLGATQLQRGVQRSRRRRSTAQSPTRSPRSRRA